MGYKLGGDKVEREILLDNIRILCTDGTATFCIKIKDMFNLKEKVDRQAQIVRVEVEVCEIN
jgi:hypothetical protein